MKAGRVPLTEASERNLAALWRAIVRSPGFGLYVLVADGPARAELMARLADRSGKVGFPKLEVFPTGKDAGKTLLGFLAGQGPAAPLAGALLPDGDQLVVDETPALALNVARDRMPSLVAGPLLLIVSPRSEVKLAQIAPDLFDIRAATYEIEAGPGLAPPRGRLESMLKSPRTRRAARATVQRADELRALEASETPPPASALADAWLRLAREEVLRGDDADPARHAADEALRLARSAWYTRGELAAQLLLAKLRRSMGDLDAADNAVSEMLSLADTLGDSVERAYALEELSENLIEHGKSEEAVQILRRDVLPLLEQLGDAKDRANAALVLAEALFRSGELDDALRTLREDCLRTYDQLGDGRMRALTMLKMVEVLRARGQLDEGLRILREEALPILEGLEDEPLLHRAQVIAALGHVERDQPGDRGEARDLLRRAGAAPVKIGQPVAEALRALLKELDLDPQ